MFHNEISGFFKRPQDTKLDAEAQYKQELKAYEETIAKIEKERKEPVSSLERHVLAFLDQNYVFSGTTVKEGLDAMHSLLTWLKGPLIAGFNATHGSENHVCPAFSAEFVKDKNGFARFLHLGTTRIWNADGSINEERMNEFKKRFPTIVTESNLNAYL